MPFRGYTQFLLDEETRKRLRVVSPDGVFEWLRMPFGPAPAPAIMQSYVAQRFGNLENPKTGRKFCSPMMDDIVVSSLTIGDHIVELRVLCRAAKGVCFEFKFKKA